LDAPRRKDGRRSPLATPPPPLRASGRPAMTLLSPLSLVDIFLSLNELKQCGYNIMMCGIIFEWGIFFFLLVGRKKREFKSLISIRYQRENRTR
jgi:hypothetical protein